MLGSTTARTLAPSKEAFDTPLSPLPLGNKPGSATGLSGDYPDGTSTRRYGPTFRTQHRDILPRTGRTAYGRHEAALRDDVQQVGQAEVLLGIIPEKL